MTRSEMWESHAVIYRPVPSFKSLIVMGPLAERRSAATMEVRIWPALEPWDYVR